jgi:UDP-N-acetylglucosamine acyltransferase
MAILKKAYMLIFRSQLNVSQAMRRIADELKQTPEILKLLNFIASSQRGIVR